jgi:NDP-sugar pyrophosphorylase family protein
MNELVIIGSGGLASEISAFIDDYNRNNKNKIIIKGYLDQTEEIFLSNKNKYNFKRPYLGSSDTYVFSNKEDYILGFSNIDSRNNFFIKNRMLDLNFINIIHPTVIMPETFNIGVGNVIYPHTVVGPHTNIGNFNIFTSYSFISHDCSIGNNNFFSTSGLSGNVSIQNNNYFGIRATVLPSVVIGSNNTIQAGMVVDKNVENNETVFYRYKEKITIIKV